MRIADITINKEENNYLRLEVYYSKGGTNVFTSGYEKRGFYLSVQEIKKEGSFIIFSPIDGFKIFISPMEIKRTSKKAEKEALENINNYKNVIITNIKRRNIDLKSNEIEEAIEKIIKN